MITAEGNETMRCNCPYCGQSLLVNLPMQVGSVLPSSQQDNSYQERSNGQGSGLKVLLTVLIVLVLGGLAVFGYVYWENEQEAAQLE